ncbi:hypothetical protein LL033_15950 [Clostridium estertheticum]|uniref:hypothetical protein n=1 Tax=Clostridium estertheticum TaxID=238834 RepID=UPI001C0E8D01|nr:hypothetical protein [Clostridium estertheticum]MBU3215883.1 hypothetical protein [Clostridium estertheticum]WAG54129.1 hypothetical protein LL033_15950 [Clostridium estertheticum]
MKNNNSNNIVKQALIMFGILFGGSIVCIMASVVIITKKQNDIYILILWVVFFVFYFVYLIIYGILKVKNGKRIEAEHKNGTIAEEEYLDIQKNNRKDQGLIQKVISVIVLIILIRQLFSLF